MKHKGIKAIFFIVFMVISTTTTAILIVDQSRTSSATLQGIEPILFIDTYQKSTQVSLDDKTFYDDIGEVYNAQTDDSITIKVLRYHPEDESFNEGGKPVLLFPGLCANINQFLMRTTPEIEERYGTLDLPDTLAAWAQGDQKIQEDPLLYYSYAYYLWSEGYDPWFANYRGVGYGEMRSENPGSKVTLDDFALYDVEAAVKKVYEVTGEHPYIGGHSTGGLTPLMYIQGTYYRWDGHVRSSSNLVKERNGIDQGDETVSGFIGLDPAWIPGMTKLLDNIFIWLLTNTNLKINIRDIVNILIDEIPLGDNILTWILNLISDKYGYEVREIFSYLLNLDTSNMSDEQLFFFVIYAVDTVYFRTLAHYLDFIAHDTVRECYKNGWFNEWLISPPNPGGWFDSYYYYIDNTYKMSVPSIIFLASEENDLTDLVDGETVVRDVHNGKTRDSNDELYWLEGAHIDMPIGLRAPEELFPKLGAWLAKT